MCPAVIITATIATTVVAAAAAAAIVVALLKMGGLRGPTARRPPLHAGGRGCGRGGGAVDVRKNVQSVFACNNKQQPDTPSVVSRKKKLNIPCTSTYFTTPARTYQAEDKRQSHHISQSQRLS